MWLGNESTRREYHHHHYIVPQARISLTLSHQPLPFVHLLWQVFRATSCILTQLLDVCSSWSSCFCPAICGDPQEYITYELVPASLAVTCMSGAIQKYTSIKYELIIWNIQHIVTFLSLRVFGLLSSSLLLFPQRFSRYVLRPSSGVRRTRKPSRNFELRPLLTPRKKI